MAEAAPSPGIYKQDIDDNCPMTGDETDTEETLYVLNQCANTLINESEAITQSINQSSENEGTSKTQYVDTLNQENSEISKPNQTLSSYQDSFSLRLVEDEDESLSSDRNFYSDEETSSIAGSYDDFGKEDYEDDSMSEPQSAFGQEEKMKRKALRNHLDRLGDLVVEKEFAVQQAREELTKCRKHLKQLETELELTSKEMKEAELNDQKATYFRLKSKKEKLSSELNIEKEVEKKVAEDVENAELHLAQTYLEHAKFLPYDDMLEAEDKENERVKADKASARIKKEMTNAAMLERRKKRGDKEHISSVRERERKNRQAIIAAKKNREVSMKYLKDTMSRVRQRESEEEDKSRNDLNQRMSALLSLKKNIELNKENISAIQSRDTYNKRQEELREEEERKKLIVMGENPDEVLTRRKRLRQFERDKTAFERKQREREIEIVNKIAIEEKQMKRRHQQQPQLWPENRPRRMPRKRSKPRCAPSSGSESMDYGADVEDTGGKISYLHKFSTDDEGEFSPYGATTRDDDRTTDEYDNSQDECKEEHDGIEETFATPEFKALWESNVSNISRNEKFSAHWKTANYEYSKYEQEMMKTALSKQKQNIVQQQVAAGREFKGPAFYSKPDIVIFKDFDLGKTYKKKILLTNVSYSQMFCKFVGLSENLQDFVEISFNPPGALSAGLTCDLYATFTPMINEDIEGCIEMMSQTGLFLIPIKCLKKRCQIEIDVNEIYFENTVAGETVKKSITVKNEGALSTEFNFQKLLLDGNDENQSTIGSIGGASSNFKALHHVSERHQNDEQENDVIENNEYISADTDNENNENTMRIGKVSSGTIAPFSSVQLDVIFAPIKASCVTCDFSVTFSDQDTSEIFLKAKGISIDLPIWVERELIDLKICMFDRLYQDAIIVSNRATSALRIRFEIPKELRNHLDILPKTAYVQAESQFSAQLKFLPRKSLINERGRYLKEDDLLEVPISIIVADQTQPVPFVVRAIVTSSDFEFSTEEINFGHCSVYETVYQNIQLRNKSVLTQQYGFVNLPETIRVQPNDGFGTILPNEKIDLYIYFSPNKAQDYRFNLLCKSHIGREFTIRCKAVGVLPPMKLSHPLIQFKATAVNDISTGSLFVMNDHESSNQFTHPVPRVGTGEIFPVGPTSFHFMVPEDAPLLISPAIGTVSPGKKCMVQVTFSPKLDSDLVEKKAFEIEQEEKENASSVDLNKPEVVESNRGTKSSGGVNGKTLLQKQSPKITSQASNTSKPGGQENMKPSHQTYVNKAQITLQRSYESNFSIFKIPCFIAAGECGSLDSNQYNIHNTLYLEVHCPSVRPSLIVVSENSDNLVDFGKVPMGQRHIKVITIQNITEKLVSLSSSILDPIGPFEMVNALRTLEPNSVHSVKFSFTPCDNNKFHEVLKIYSSTTTVEVRLVGQGVKPQLALEPSSKTFDVGDAVVTDTIYQALKITNISELSVVYDLKLGSLMSTKHSRMQKVPLGFIRSTQNNDGKMSQDNEFLIGPPNKSGLCVFGCEPTNGTLEPGENKEILISFSPDHSSQLFRDELTIDVNGVKEFVNLHLVGRAWPSITFTKGWDRLSPTEETLTSSYINSVDEPDKNLEKTVLLTMSSSLVGSVFETSEHIIEIGCIKTNIQIRKSSDFSFENTKDAFDKGFQIEPLKGGVDIGMKKPIVFKWTPPSNGDPQEVTKSIVQLILRGDTTTTYKILLRGCIKSKLP